MPLVAFVGRALARLVLVFVAAELMAMAAFTLTLRHQLQGVWHVDGAAVIAAVDDAHIATFAEQLYDPLLGWTFKPATTAIPYTAFDARGARRDSRPWTGRIVAYGDSRTFGANVADDATWPHALGELLGEGVANFGVLRYGPDQAFLRLRENVAVLGSPDVVIFGISSDGIARAVNAWSYLYDREEPLAFKPMLEVGGGRWLPNPLASLTDRDSIAAALTTAASAPDYWQIFNESRPVPEFPYLWAAADTADYLLVRARRWQDLWQEPRAVATMDAIVDELVSLARVRGFRPVLLFIPLVEDVRLHAAGKPATYATFAAQTANTYADRLIVADPLAVGFHAGLFAAAPNQVLAETVFAALRSIP